MTGNVGQFLTYDEETRCDSEADIHADLENTVNTDVMRKMRTKKTLILANKKL